MMNSHSEKVIIITRAYSGVCAINYSDCSRPSVRNDNDHNHRKRHDYDNKTNDVWVPDLGVSETWKKGGYLLLGSL